MTYKGKPQPLPREARADPLRDYPELKTDTVFLIGNGESRKHFDLEKLRGKGTIIGCNALYRDFVPDILVAIDAKMLNELKKAKYDEENIVLIPANRSIALSRQLRWKCHKFNTSGCFAMQFIKQIIKAKNCYMLGMDGYPGNVYLGSKNYEGKGTSSYTTIINYYIIALDIPGETVFINVNHKDAWEKQVKDRDNYKCISYKQFDKILTN